MKYYVTLPVCGSITVEVEAENESEAVNKDHEEQDWRIESGENTEPGEFESMNEVCLGNVCHAPCSEYSVEEAE